MLNHYYACVDFQVKYHAEFEKAKGKFTQVADDPETLRIKQNSKIIRYHYFKELVLFHFLIWG